MMGAEALWASLDPARRAQFMRSLDVAGAGSVLLQTYINRVVQSLVLRELGALATLPKKEGSGNAAYINRRTPGTTQAQWISDTGSPIDEVGTYAQTSFTYRTLIRKGSVTRKLMATGRSYGDVLGEEVGQAVDDLREIYEQAIFTGCNGTDSNQPDGLITLIQAVTAQVVANTTSASGDDLTLANLDKAIDLVKGSGNRSDLVIYGSQRGCRLLNAALQAQQQFNDAVEIAAGFRVRSYDQIPIVVSTEIPDVLVWNGSNKITAFTGGSTTCLVVVNKRYTWLEELTPLTVMPLARTTSQNEAFELFVDTVPVYANTKGGAIVAGLSGS